MDCKKALSATDGDMDKAVAVSYTHLPAVAIVGARACTEYGKEAAGFYAGELANAGVNVISGMAAGVDDFAHRGAIERGKPTLSLIHI